MGIKTKLIKEVEVLAICALVSCIKTEDQSNTPDSFGVLKNKLLQNAELKDEFKFDFCGHLKIVRTANMTKHRIHT